MQSDRASTSGGDEEADNHTMTRMLEDGTGRLVYMGDASTLSFLQLLRMIVETTVGPSPFTMDPERHKIKEIPFSLPSDTELTHLLPDRQTALILVDSFFVNVSIELSQSVHQKPLTLNRRTLWLRCLTRKNSSKRWTDVIQTLSQSIISFYVT